MQPTYLSDSIKIGVGIRSLPLSILVNELQEIKHSLSLLAVDPDAPEQVRPIWEQNSSKPLDLLKKIDDLAFDMLSETEMAFRSVASKIQNPTSIRLRSMRSADRILDVFVAFKLRGQQRTQQVSDRPIPIVQRPRSVKRRPKSPMKPNREDVKEAFFRRLASADG